MGLERSKNGQALWILLIFYCIPVVLFYRGVLINVHVYMFFDDFLRFRPPDIRGCDKLGRIG